MNALAFSSYTPNPSNEIDHLVGLDNGHGQPVSVCIGAKESFVSHDETDYWPESYGGFEGFNQRALAYAAALKRCREFEDEVTRFVASVEAAPPAETEPTAESMEVVAMAVVGQTAVVKCGPWVVMGTLPISDDDSPELNAHRWDGQPNDEGEFISVGLPLILEFIAANSVPRTAQEAA